MPRFFAAFSVLKRVRKLALKNNMTKVLFFPKLEFSNGSIFNKIASFMVSERFEMSAMVVYFFILTFKVSTALDQTKI